MPRRRRQSSASASLPSGALACGNSCQPTPGPDHAPPRAGRIRWRNAGAHLSSITSTCQDEIVWRSRQSPLHPVTTLGLFPNTPACSALELSSQRPTSTENPRHLASQSNNGIWTASAWSLERRHPQHSGRRETPRTQDGRGTVVDNRSLTVALDGKAIQDGDLAGPRTQGGIAITAAASGFSDGHRGRCAGARGRRALESAHPHDGRREGDQV
jgi:hypothetical protein